MKTEIYAERHIYANRIAFYAREHLNGGRVAVMRPVIFEEIKDESLVFEPAFHLQPDEAQLLMDELWRCGLRPTEGTGSAGSLAATERHLKDLQGMTRGLLKKFGVET